MTRNTKIALGCGGAGCLGLVLAVVAVVVAIAAGVIKAPGITSYFETDNSNSNNNYNYNSNVNRNSNTNSNTNQSSTSTSMSDDDKHRLFQAAAAADDAELSRKAWEKIGLVKANGTFNDDYGPFVREHIGWIFKNRELIQSINTPAKARAYVEEHIDD
jgi:hypothetical protein